MRDPRTKVKLPGKAALSEQDFYKLWHKAQGVALQDSNADAAAEVWKLITPYLQREFLLKEVEIILSEMIEYFESDKKEIPEIRWASAIGSALYKFKCLLNGVSENSTNLLIPSDMICDNCGQLECKCEKPVCPTCGGSGKKCPSPCTPGDNQLCELNCRYHIPCPECTEKPKCLRCGEVEDNDWCKYKLYHRFTDERVKHRRLGKETTSDHKHNDGTPSPTYGEYISSTSRKAEKPDRREEDRRNKTSILIGSLKGMEPQ